MFAKNNRRLLLLALALAVICSAVGYLYLKDLEESAIATPLDTVVTVKVPVDARVRLTSEMLAESKVPAEAIHPAAIRTVSEAIGKVTCAPLIAGEQLLKDRIVPGSDRPSLAYQIPKGKRAITIGVDERIAVGMLIHPGDQVDISAAYKNIQNKEAVKIILQSIEVLAVGQRLNEKSSPDNPGVVNTVTLAVAPEQAEELMWAEEYGKIRLLLRPATEETRANTPGITVDTIR